eukprot:SAG31_NODE_4910_length_2872_cov_2.604039_3_plen_92_part_00
MYSDVPGGARGEATLGCQRHAAANLERAGAAATGSVDGGICPGSDAPTPTNMRKADTADRKADISLVSTSVPARLFVKRIHLAARHGKAVA